MVHFVQRLTLSQWALNLVGAGFTPTTVQFAAGSIRHYTIRQFSLGCRASRGDPPKRHWWAGPEDPLSRQFLGKPAGGRAQRVVGSGRQSRFTAISGRHQMESSS